MIGNLDSIDRKIIFELEKNSRIPENALARKLRISREVVRYRMNQLTKMGIIEGYTTWINIVGMGYQCHKVYLKLFGDQKTRDNFLNLLKERQDVFWIGVADGSWDVGVTFFSKSNSSYYSVRRDLFSTFSATISDKRMGLVVNAYTYGLKFLTPSENENIGLFDETTNHDVDSLDRRILKELFLNSRIRLVDLARKCSSSMDTIRNRIKNLEKNGIITRYTIRLNHQKLGVEFYKAFLYFDLFDQNVENKLVEFCNGHPNIVHLVKTITPWEIELEIMVESHSQYNSVLHELRNLLPKELINIESAILSHDYVFPAKKSIFD